MRPLVDLVLLRVAIALVVVEMTARVVGCGYGLKVFGADDEGVAEAVAVAVEHWPEVEEVADRLDVFVVGDAAIRSPARCNSGNQRVAGCLMWIGSDARRARAYALDSEPLPAVVLHELQHAHLWADDETRACASHSPDCGWIDVDLEDAP